jgi:PAS domain S-box-containing protein
VEVEGSSEQTHQPAPDGSPVGGGMAALVRATDWSQTPLGPMDRWPQALQTAIGICLSSRFPMFLWWGPHLVNIYNDAYVPILGRRHPDALGRSAPDVWREVWPVIGPQVEAVLTRGEASWHHRVPLVLERNGYPEEAFFTWSHGPVPDERGGIGGVLCVVTEETASVLAERERDRLAAHRQVALDAAAMGWWHYDPQTKLATYDRRYTEIFGVTGSSRPNDEILKRLHPDDLPGVWARVEAALDPADPQPYAAEYRVVLDDGSVRWVEAHGRATFAGEGGGRRAVSFVGTVADVTDRRRDEQERATLLGKLEHQTRLFDATLSAVRDYFFLFDRDGRFLYGNKALLDLLGLPAEQVIGRSMADLRYPPEVEAQLLANIRRVFETGQPAHDETPYTSPTGASGYYEYILAPVLAPGGSVQLVAGTSRDVTARKQLAAERERLLREIESERANLAAMIEQAPAFICTLGGPDHVLELANERYYQLIGRRGVLGMPIRAALPEVEGQGFFELLDRVYRTGEPFVGNEVPALLGPAGAVERRFVNFVYQALRGTDGGVSGIFVHGVDVTDLVRSRDALREGEAYLRAVLDSSAGGFYGVDGDGGTTVVNAAFARMLGFGRPEDAVGRKLHDVIHHTRPDGSHYPKGQCPIYLAAQSGRPAHVEGERFFRLDGTSFPVEYWTQPIVRDGRTHGAVTTFIDVTDRRVAEERLREESNAVETINRVGRAVAAELDLERLVQTVTDATTNLTGAQFGAFFYNVVNDKGESYSLYAISGVDRAHFDKFPMPRNTDIFAPTFAGEGVVRLDDVTADPRYGRHAPYHGMPQGHLPVRSYLAVPVVSRSGEVLGGLFFGHEAVGVFAERHERIVTGIAAQAAVAIDNARLFEAARRANAEKDRLLDSERAARAEAERQGRLKDEFVSTLSHELRTPLNAILGYAQLMGRDPSLSDDAAEGLAVIERNARVQAQIVEDILDVSRLVAGKMRLDVQPVDLPAVIAAALETCKPAADAKAIRLTRLIDPQAGPVSGDPARLQQCVWNLVSNSIKFSPKGARVQVVLQRVNSHVEIAVSDTGQGIKPDFLPHVFERFRQADGTTTRRSGGLGLGLGIVKSLVELHGGNVRAHSDGEGRGATFTISLPLAPVSGPDSEPERRHPKSPRAVSPAYERLSLKGVTVLSVDDEPDARELVRRLLVECGATVVTAGSAEEALAAMDAGGPIDLLISDIGMPETDGYELIRRVRQRGPERGGDVPAVALTAYARSEDRTRAMLAGFHGHVAKPVEPAELVATVASLARRAGRP